MDIKKPDSDERHAVLLRLPKEMHQELKALAKSNGKTVSAEIIQRLQESFPTRSVFGSIDVETGPGYLPVGLAKDPYERAEVLLGNCISDYQAEVKNLAQLIAIRTDFISELEAIRHQDLVKKLTPKSDEEQPKKISIAEIRRQWIDQEITGLGSGERRIRTVLKAVLNLRLRAEETWNAYINVAKTLG